VKAALIPPIPELPKFGYGDFHLLLSHLMDNDEYVHHYKEQRRRGAYLVLDNSAHENNSGETAEKLAKQALRLNAQEVVVPDHLFDAEKTVMGAIAAMETWFERGTVSFQELSPCLMYVPQGKSEADWVECLKELMRIHIYLAKARLVRRDLTIGLSKDYEMWPGGLSYLIERYLFPLREDAWSTGIRMNVHLLGWGRELRELSRIADQFPWVRSTDSAKPFVYAMSGIRLTKKKIQMQNPPTYPGRPARYFQTRLDSKGRAISMANVRVFKDAAS